MLTRQEQEDETPTSAHRTSQVHIRQKGWMKFLAETSCPVCIGCHIQTALLAEVTDFSFLLPATTIRKKKKKKPA